MPGYLILGRKYGGSLQEELQLLLLLAAWEHLTGVVVGYGALRRCDRGVEVLM